MEKNIGVCSKSKLILRLDWTNYFEMANQTVPLTMCACSVIQSCPTLCSPVDYSLLGSSVHGIITQARILEWVAISSFRGFSQPRNWTYISCTAGRFFTTESPWWASFPHIHTTNISNAYMSQFLQTPFSLLHQLSKSWLTCLRIFSSLKKGSKLRLIWHAYKIAMIYIIF